ncbi:kinesin-like protein KIF19 isoform X3 [Alligator mississippiensis]|uniref:kinesin-like protein KIF19 isoform X3 n=1 Tax=Alligator mississippiensis TaxID=8496 RepID=UPI0028772BCF|nr:kinesin-like protein KIF19 isoform X3 [Alligator mississippiensis]
MGWPDVHAMPTAVCGSGAPRGSPLVPAVFQVALRIRPISVAELEEGAALIAHRVDEQVVVLMDPMEDPDDILRANRSREKSYVFDVAFDFTATQEVVYRATTKGLIEGVISGYNATVFAYGPTGCGKTYTMLGTDQEPGIYVRTLNDLFRAIEETSDDMEYEVSMSYLEIYNEMIRDLLNPALGYLDLREDSKGVIQVAGITEVSTINAKEVMQLLTKGNKQRMQEPTAANRTSSRSHAVLQVTVRQKSRVRNVLQEIRLGRLFMIDLAGSERASQTQNRGQRMKEGAHINRSLLALGNCINALSDRAGAKYVNYRDSKLTRLLKDSLGGNSRTVMIAHISPASTAFEESRSTLTYADRAKNIRTTVKRNLLNVSYHIAQYTSIISDLRREIQRLKGKIDQQGSRPPDHGNIRHIQAEVQLHSSQCTRRETEQLQAQLVGTFQEQMDVRRHLLTLDNACTEVQLESSRHLLTVADWEQEKTRRAQKRRGERRKETRGKDESEKDSDTGDDQSDAPEPPEVAVAREAIAALLGEQKKLHKQKGELEWRLRELQQRGRQLEEALPRPVGAEEQREALGLLCRVRQLEAESAALQLHRDDAAQRFEQHRRLCHQIIRQQRQLIREYHLSVPRHLEELYEIYLRELEESGLDRVASKTLKLPQLPVGDGALDSDQESVRTLGSEPPAPPPRDSRRSTLPPLVGEAESNPAQMFKASPRAQLLKSSAVQTPPPIHINGLVTQECPPRDSLVSLGSQRTSSPDSGELCTDFALAHRAELKEILSGTKSIAVKAARRRSQALECDRLPLLEPAKEPSSLSLHSLSESEDPLSPATPLGRRAPSPSLPHAASEDNLSSSTGEAGSRAGGTLPNRSPGPWLRAHKKGSKKLERREESLDAKRRRRRSRSFEVTGHGLSGLKSNVPRCRPLESSSEHRLLGGSQLAPPARAPSKAPLHLAKVRLPQSQPPGPEDSPALPLALPHPGGLKKGPATSQRPRPGYIAVNAGSKDSRSRRY